MIYDVCGAKILRISDFNDFFSDCYDMDVIIWGVYPCFRLFYLLYLLDVLLLCFIPKINQEREIGGSCFLSYFCIRKFINSNN